MRVANGDAAKALRARLVELAGEAIAEVVETNVFFDDADGRLKAGGCGLRVRIERHAADGAVRRAVTTFKGPREPGPIKRREEIEYQVSDPAAARALLEHLGYAAKLEFEKRRATWRLDGCEVVLDELPELGHFIEIEGPSDDAVLAVRTKLGLDNVEMLTDAYATMIARHLSGREPRLVFDA